MLPETHRSATALEIPGALRDRIRNLNLSAFSPVFPEEHPEEAKELARYRIQHDAYITGVSDGIREYSTEAKGLVLQDTSEPSFFSSDPEDISFLNLEDMGLPALSGDNKEERPIAVLIGRGKDEATDSDKSISLVTISADGHRTQQHILENMGVMDTHVEVAKEDQHARWVDMGKVVASPVGLVQSSTPDTEQSMLRITFKPLGGQNQVASIVRAKPSASERSYEARNGKPISQKSRRAVQFVGAVAAATGLLLAPSPKAAAEWEPTSASEMVRETGTSVSKGIPQAEQFFDAATLNRSRAAFEAYENGDSASLAQQTELYSYHADWMDTEKLKEVRASQNAEELERSFDAIFSKESIKIELDVLDQDTEVLIANSTGGHTHTRASNFENVKTTALAAVDTFNLLDKNGMRKVSMRVSIAGKLSEAGNSDKELNGYYQPSTSKLSTPHIVLASEGKGWNPYETMPHEFGHHITMKNGGKGVSRINTLKPEAYTYVGEEYEGSPLNFEGVEVVQESYGNKNKLERSAVASESAFSVEPHALNEQSYAGEAASAVIFDMEDQMPGFTASYLQRAAIARQNSQQYNKFLEIGFRLLTTTGILLGGIGDILHRRRRSVDKINAGKNTPYS